MTHDDETGFLGEGFGSPLPFTFQMGDLSVTLEPELHDDTAWTPVESRPSSEVPSDFGPMIRLDSRTPGRASPHSDSSPPEDDVPPPPETNPPIPPPKETPS